MAFIGISPMHDHENDRLWVNKEYFKLFKSFDFDIVVLSYEDHEESVRRILNRLDGLVLTGGPDISPRYYNEDLNDGCKETSRIRDKSEYLLAKVAYEMDVPTFGICRGLQMMNVSLGGTLIQDIDKECDDIIRHDLIGPYHDINHKVYPVKNTYFSKLYDKEFFVTSLHHQGIKDISDKLSVGLRSIDHMVEAIYAKDKSFYVGVQFHPELMYKEIKEIGVLIGNFKQACEKRG